MSNNIQDLVINADDFGMSKGVNFTLQELLIQKYLNSVSLMTTGKYFTEACEFIKSNKILNFKVGLHLDLLVHDGFLKLLLKTIFNRKKTLIKIYKEILVQLNKLKEENIKISHIDGHRHVHMIPGIFYLVQRVAKKYEIKRVRVINENLFFTLKNYKSCEFLFNGGIIKYILLKLFTLINGVKSDYYFFSILHSCTLDIKKLKEIDIPKKYKNSEIMLHPGNPKIDQEDPNISINPEKDHLISDFRIIETTFAQELNKFLD